MTTIFLIYLISVLFVCVFVIWWYFLTEGGRIITEEDSISYCIIKVALISIFWPLLFPIVGVLSYKGIKEYEEEAPEGRIIK